MSGSGLGFHDLIISEFFPVGFAQHSLVIMSLCAFLCVCVRSCVCVCVCAPYPPPHKRPLSDIYSSVNRPQGRARINQSLALATIGTVAGTWRQNES